MTRLPAAGCRLPALIILGACWTGPPAAPTPGQRMPPRNHFGEADAIVLRQWTNSIVLVSLSHAVPMALEEIRLSKEIIVDSLTGEFLDHDHFLMIVDGKRAVMLTSAGLHALERKPPAAIPHQAFAFPDEPHADGYHATLATCTTPDGADHIWDAELAELHWLSATKLLGITKWNHWFLVDGCTREIDSGMPAPIAGPHGLWAAEGNSGGMIVWRGDEALGAAPAGELRFRPD